MGIRWRRARQLFGVVVCSGLAVAPCLAAQSGQFIQSGQQAIDMENYPSAASLFNQAIQSARSNKDGAEEMIARGGLGEALMWQGDFAGAGKIYKSIIPSAAKTLGETPALARIYDSYAWLLQAQGKRDEATAYCNMGLELRKKVAPNTESLSESYENLASIQELQGLLDAAAQSYANAIAVRQALGPGQQITIANLQEKLAMMLMKSGKYPEAQRYFNLSMELKSATHAAMQEYVPHPWTQTVMFRFANGAPYCGRTATGALAIQTHSNILVEASLDSNQDINKATRYRVRITNNSPSPIDVLPRPPILVVLSPDIKVAKLLDADTLARTIEKKGDRKASIIRFFGADANTAVQSTIVSSPGWGGYRNNWGYGYNPPMYNNFNNRGVQTTQITTFVPDYEARARAEAKAQDAINNARRTADQLRSQVVTHSTLPVGESMEGTLQFDATKIQSALLRIPIGNAVFEFPLGPGQQ